MSMLRYRREVINTKSFMLSAERKDDTDTPIGEAEFVAMLLSEGAVAKTLIIGRRP